MSGGRCNGACCAVFYLPFTPLELASQAVSLVDGVMVAAMAIPLTDQEARERSLKFGGTGDLRRKAGGNFYTCRYWDEQTRLCRNYERRPTVCRGFPYGRECSYGCGYSGGFDLVEKAEQEVTA